MKYKYFVSFMVQDLKTISVYSDFVYETDKLITNQEDINKLRKYIEDEIRIYKTKRKHKEWTDTDLMAAILNFQLLNKEDTNFSAGVSRDSNNSDCKVRKHACWREFPQSSDVHCSNCGEGIYWSDFNYNLKECPNCHAIMDLPFEEIH